MSICYVIPTMGRKEELADCLRSILVQGTDKPELVIVDQNAEPFLRPMLEQFKDNFDLTHIEVGKPLGSSGARNLGWQTSKSDLVIFPDDDCTYPEGLISRMLHKMEDTGADIISGRCADEAGLNRNGNFSAVPAWVGRANIWTTQIEWMLLFRREVLVKIQGFDPQIGVGCYYGSCEGQDISLRALDAGFTQYYDPDLFGHHPNVLLVPGPETARKCRRYGRGMGYVLKRYNFPITTRIKYILRPLLRAGFTMARLRIPAANLALQTALGRLEGMKSRI